MNTVLLADFVDRLHPALGFQTHFRLELGAVYLPLLRFAYRFSLMTVRSLNHCFELGGHYIPTDQQIVDALLIQ